MPNLVLSVAAILATISALWVAVRLVHSQASNGSLNDDPKDRRALSLIAVTLVFGVLAFAIIGSILDIEDLSHGTLFKIIAALGLALICHVCIMALVGHAIREKIDVIALGIGPRLWRMDYGTRLELGSIPIGGYVKFRAIAAQNKMTIDALCLITMFLISCAIIGVGPAWHAMISTWSELFGGLATFSLQAAFDRLVGTVETTPFIRFSAMMLAATTAINMLPLSSFSGGALLLASYKLLFQKEPPRRFLNVYLAASMLLFIYALGLTILAAVE